jgi:hypothetical protein
MAKNLLQASQVYSHRPIVLEEAPEPWQTAEAIASTFFDPDATRADRALQLEEDEFSLRKMQDDRNYELAQDTLDLEQQRTTAEIRSSEIRNKIERDKLDADLIKDSTEDLPWQYKARVAGELGSPLAGTYGIIAGDMVAAEGAFNKAINEGDSKQANRIFRDNYDLFGSEKKSLEKKEKDLHGLFALQALPSLVSMPGVENLVGQSQLQAWKDVSTPDEALRYLNSFIPTIGAAGQLNRERYEALKNVGDVLSTLSAAAVDSGSETLVNALNEKIPTYMNQLSRFLGPQDFKTDEQKTVDTVDYKFITAGIDDPKTAIDERARVPLDPSKRYSVQFKTIDGSTKKLEMTGEEASRREKKEGIKIISTDIIAERIVSRNGKPNIEVNEKIKDLKTGKILTYEGLQEVVTNVPYSKTKYLQFRDSDGKRVRYTVGQAYNRKFGPPTGAPQPIQQDRIAGGGLQVPTQSAYAGQPPTTTPSDSLQSLQDVFDTYENIVP